VRTGGLGVSFTHASYSFRHGTSWSQEQRLWAYCFYRNHSPLSKYLYTPTMRVQETGLAPWSQLNSNIY